MKIRLHGFYNPFKDWHTHEVGAVIHYTPGSFNIVTMTKDGEKTLCTPYGDLNQAIRKLGRPFSTYDTTSDAPRPKLGQIEITLNKWGGMNTFDILTPEEAAIAPKPVVVEVIDKSIYERIPAFGTFFTFVNINEPDVK